MRLLSVTAVALLVSTISFADAQSSGFAKNSTQLNALGSAFKSQPVVAPTINPNDITMGYAGEDVANKYNVA